MAAWMSAEPMDFEVGTGGVCGERPRRREGFSPAMTERVLVLPTGVSRAGIERMKMRRWIGLAWLGGSVVAALAAEPEIEFTGVLVSGSETQIAVKRKDDTARWLRVGQSLAGYTLAGYDAPTETLTVTKDGQTYRLKMREAKIAKGSGEPPPEIKKSVLNNLRQLAAAADQYYLENGRSTASYDQLVGPTKYVKQLVPAAGEDYRGVEFVQGRTLRVTTNTGHVVTFAP